MLNCLISHGVGNDMKKTDKGKSIPIRKSLRSFSQSNNPIKWRIKNLKMMSAIKRSNVFFILLKYNEA
jgi:hypothetical protein